MSSKRIVLVTGCSDGGLGFHLCERFAEEGCKVYATARRFESMTAFKDVSIEKLTLDVTNDEDVLRAVGYIEEKEGRIDIVVNNAGMSGIGPIADVSVDWARHVYDANVFSIIRMAKAVIPVMAKRKQGVIVNIGSIAGSIPSPWNGLYSSSKAAVSNLSDALWMECIPFNISVMHVAPGMVESNIAKNASSNFISLPTDSLYKPYLPDILRRLHISQGPGKMSGKEFAKRVVGQALSGSPPRYYTLAKRATLFRILEWLPRGLVLWVMWKQFSQRK